jgi:hypothetical protein
MFCPLPSYLRRAGPQERIRCLLPNQNLSGAVQAGKLELSEVLSDAAAALRARKATALAALQQAAIGGARKAFNAAREDAHALGLVEECRAAEATAASRRDAALRAARATVQGGALPQVQAKLMVCYLITWCYRCVGHWLAGSS